MNRQNRWHICFGLLTWMLNSIVLIIFNKYIITEVFPFPVTLTLTHMLTAYVLSGLAHVDGDQIFHLNRRQVLLIAFLFALSLVLRNTAYIYVSVAIIQMVSAFSPLAVYLITCAVGLEIFCHQYLISILIVSCGICLASIGFIDVNWLGVMFQICGIIVEAARTAILQVVLQDGVKVDKMLLLRKLCPICAVALAPFSIREMQLSLHTFHFNHTCILLIILNSIIAFTMNIASLHVIQISSSLTISLCSIVRDWILICVSYLLFNAKLTITSLFGWAITTVGLLSYAKKRYGSS